MGRLHLIRRLTLERDGKRPGEAFQFREACVSTNWVDAQLDWRGFTRPILLFQETYLQRLQHTASTTGRFTEQYLDSTGMFKEAVIGILAAVAKQERVGLSERTIAGLERAKAQGRVGGRPKAEDAEPKLVAKVGRLRSEGRSIRAIANEVGKSPNTVLRLLKSEYAVA